MSNLLDSASIVLTPTAYDNGRMLSVKPNTDLFGAELVTNGDFATDSNWNKNSNWTISGGVAIADGSSDLDINQGTTIATIGKSYKITYEVVSISQGGFFFKFGGVNGVPKYSVGVYTEIIQAVNTNRIALDSENNAIGSIDNISIKEDLSGDFDFSRNSAATRVNAQGLVENVQILSGDLVSNGDFSQEGAEEVSNGSFSQEGAEWFNANNVFNRDNSTNTINLNGTITTELNTSSIGWTINAASILNQNKTYKVEWEILSTNSSSGTFSYWEWSYISKFW